MHVKWNTNYIIKIVIMLAIMFTIGKLPPFGMITPFGMRILGVFAGILFGWIAIDIMVPAMFGFVALCLAGYGTVVGNLGTAFSNMTVLMVLFSGVFAGAMERAHVIDVATKVLFTRKFLDGKPWLLVGSILFCAYLAQLLDCGFAGIFLIWALAIDLCKEAGYGAKSPLVCFLITNIVVINMSAAQAFPWKAGTLAYLGFAGVADMPFMPYLILGNVLILCVIVLTTLIGKYILRIDASRLVLTAEQKSKYENMEISNLQKIGLTLIVLFVFAMLLPNFLPAGPVKAMMNSIGLCGWMFIVIVIMAFLVKEDGTHLLTPEACFASVPWSVVFIVGLAMPLGDALKSPDSGVMATVMTSVGGLFNGMSVQVYMIVATLILLILTQFMNNLVLGAVLSPVLMGICTQMGGNTYVLGIMFVFALNCAYLTPAASLYGAMVHGHELMHKGEAYKNAVVAMIVQFALYIVIYMGLGSILM